MKCSTSCLKSENVLQFLILDEVIIKFRGRLEIRVAEVLDVSLFSSS